MMHHAKYIDGFWKSMGERFGKRWFDSAGPLPNKEWRELLNEFTREEIETALLRLKDRPERDRMHPPAYVEFQALLSKAARNRETTPGGDSRGYWQSVITGTCMRHAALLNIVHYGETSLGKLPTDVYRIVSGTSSELLKWACETEEREGQRTKEMEQHISSTLWRLLKPWERHDVSRGTETNTRNQAGPVSSAGTDSVSSYAQGEFAE